MKPPSFPETVSSKAEFYELWRRRAIGNRLRFWDRAEDIPEDFHGLIMVRSFKSGVPSAVFGPAVARASFKGRAGLRFNECAPDEQAILQAYVREISNVVSMDAWVRSLRKRYRRGYRMKEATRWFRHYQGLTAIEILRARLSPGDYEDLRELLDLYPEHVVELTAYSIDLGWSRGRNTLFWELRKF